MTVVELAEYEPRLYRLSNEERRQLLETGLVTVTDAPMPGWFSVRAENVVGTVVLPGLTLLIRPKFDLRNVFFLLGYAAPGRIRWDPSGRFPYLPDDDLFSAIARLLEHEARWALRRGIVRDYRWREEPLPTLRGRIDVARQVARHPGMQFPLECRFEEFTEDTELFRVIKAAHKRSLRLPRLARQTVIGLQNNLRALADVEDADYSPASVPRLRFTRLNQGWESAARLAELILRHDSVRDRLGKRLAISFKVDMNKAFEDFIQAVVAERVAGSGWTFEAQAPRSLTVNVPIAPDLVIRGGSTDRAVGDAKYKRLAEGGHKNADLYQLISYMLALGVRRGLLIYGEALKPRREEIWTEHGPLHVDIFGVDLAGTPNDVLRRARTAADQLIWQAGQSAALSAVA